MIVGCGGASKTTLARKVFYDHHIRNAFSTVLWVRGSKDFTDMELLYAIASAAGLKTGEAGSREKIEELLAFILEGQRFLLVLDDDPTWKEWQKVSDCEGWSTMEIPDGMKKIAGPVQVAYSDLPSHLRQCLLYCLQLPEGFIISKDLATQLWISEGFIEEQDGYSPEDTAHEYYKELVLTKLLQPDIEEQYGYRPEDTAQEEYYRELVLRKLLQPDIEEQYGYRPEDTAQESVLQLYTKDLHIPGSLEPLSRLSKLHKLLTLDLDGTSPHLVLPRLIVSIGRIQEHLIAQKAALSRKSQLRHLELCGRTSSSTGEAFVAEEEDGHCISQICRSLSLPTANSARTSQPWDSYRSSSFSQLLAFPNCAPSSEGKQVLPKHFRS
ncbi:hypothetical protein BAE44_0019225 [Dichanthelium oligosanthes]|uniref:Uncharacterized protein n=1 Tax=Dichanthelium oligosanthes TaxID=888268 RepID=A0A1E5V426_9POAL|nr:hypothetical protein BAE44_0019225 [Dichanthelium oligosanthes]